MTIRDANLFYKSLKQDLFLTRFRALRIQCYLLIVNLAVSNFFMGAVVMPLTAYVSFFSIWPFSDAGDKIILNFPSLIHDIFSP